MDAVPTLPQQPMPSASLRATTPSNTSIGTACLGVGRFMALLLRPAVGCDAISVCHDGFFDRAGACVGGGLVWRRSMARWRLRPAIEVASMMAGPCMPQRIPDRAVTFIVFFSFLVLINIHLVRVLYYLQA
jgi:hypothetical protein